MHRFFLTILCALAAGTAAAVSAPIPCGSLIPAVGAHCGNPDRPSQAACCEALAALEEEQCWCDPAAFSVLRLMATNSYAFSARHRACGFLRPQVPPLPPPHRKAPHPPGTCVAPTPAELNSEPGCKPNVKARRKHALNLLDNLVLTADTTAAVTAFRGKVAKLFALNIVFSNIGQVSVIGRAATGDYLLARQKVLGADAPLLKPKRRGNIRWRQNTASYTLAVYIPGRTLAVERMVWVSFKKCTTYIDTFTMTESNFLTAQFAQFYYPSTDGFGPIDGLQGVQKRVCGAIQTACREKNYPYTAPAACEKSAQNLQDTGRVMCNSMKSLYTPQLAMHGDTLACRRLYAVAARIHPAKYCSWLGPVGMGACSKSSCPNALYDDIFASEGRPRVSGAGSAFQCNFNTSICHEIWPPSSSDSNPTSSFPGNPGGHGNARPA